MNVLRRVLGDRRFVRRFGSFREREAWGLVERPNYAYGVLRAADVARFCGKKAVTVCEFGVAHGRGLENLAEVAGLVRAETGVEVRVFGFDTGGGLPEVVPVLDHPELWSTGDFPMVDRDALHRRLNGRAKVIYGDIADTIDEFVRGLSADAPIGFVSVDVDIYTGAKSALRVFDGPPDRYLPGVSTYFDDLTFFFANRWCGELLAIDEFNNSHDRRKIDIDRSLPGRRPVAATNWYRCMYVCHVLDHELRQRPRDRGALSIDDHYRLMLDHGLI